MFSLNNDPMRERANLSVCPCCGQFNFAPAFEGPICYQLDGEPAGRMGKSQHAALLRFIAFAPGPVIEQHLSRALGNSDQVSRSLRRIRQHNSGLLAKPRIVRSLTGGRPYALYSLAKNVCVWEPGNG